MIQTERYVGIKSGAFSTNPDFGAATPIPPTTINTIRITLDGKVRMTLDAKVRVTTEMKP